MSTSKSGVKISVLHPRLHMQMHPRHLVPCGRTADTHVHDMQNDSRRTVCDTFSKPVTPGTISFSIDCIVRLNSSIAWKSLSFWGAGRLAGGFVGVLLGSEGVGPLGALVLPVGVLVLSCGGVAVGGGGGAGRCTTAVAADVGVAGVGGATAGHDRDQPCKYTRTAGDHATCTGSSIVYTPSTTIYGHTTKLRTRKTVALPPPPAYLPVSVRPSQTLHAWPWQPSLGHAWL